MSATLTETTLHRLDEGGSMDIECHENSQMLNYGINSSTNTVSEIEEEDDETHHHHDGPMATINEEQDCVYVAVGKSETSMEALSWTLMNLATHSTTLFLIHVFPEINHIPNPLGIGMVLRNQVSAEQVESFMAQEKEARGENSSTSSSNHALLPRKSRSKKGNGVADQILNNAPQSCKVRIICEGKEVNEKMMSPPPQTLTARTSANDTSMTRNEEDQQHDSVSCICFKPKFK